MYTKTIKYARPISENSMLTKHLFLCKDMNIIKFSLVTEQGTWCPTTGRSLKFLYINYDKLHVAKWLIMMVCSNTISQYKPS